MPKESALPTGLKSTLNTLGNLTDEETEFASPFFVPEEIKKGGYYLKEDQIPTKVSFIQKGLFRLFYRLNGEEKIMLFFSENEFMTDYYGFLTNTKTIRPIQALEDSVIFSIEKKHLLRLYQQSKNWERIGRVLSESAYIMSVVRANRLLHDDFNTRVHTFLEESPSLLQRVPQYMIASYLNMKPETFSRVKSRILKMKEKKDSVHKNTGTM